MSRSKPFKFPIEAPASPDNEAERQRLHYTRNPGGRPTEDEHRRIVSQVIHRAMLKKNWTQGDLWRAASDRYKGPKRISQNQVSQWVRGIHAPSYYAARALEDALDLEPHSLSQDQKYPTEIEGGSSVKLESADSGFANLAVNAKLPFKLAMHIVQMIKDYEEHARSEKSR